MSDVIFYTTDDGATKIDLRLENGTIWLSQLQIAELFQTSKQNISKHIQAIYDDHELDEQATINHELTVQKEGEREVYFKARNSAVCQEEAFVIVFHFKLALHIR